ncbi:hypothetical protein TNCV_4428091 [Trichonephila clavipes]|nr:hypothetical protein TNCV_4428091 [Trichonephila clavipes]
MRTHNDQSPHDALHNYEPWSSDEDDTSAGTSPSSKQPHHANVRTLSLDIFNVHRPHLYGGSSVTPRLEPMTLRPRVGLR